MPLFGTRQSTSMPVPSGTMVITVSAVVTTSGGDSSPSAAPL
jgi:hypothetical protein